MILTAAFTVATSLAAEEPASTINSVEFRWQALPIGGGGRCMDVLPHPNVEGLIYARSDVGGLFRRRAGEQQWTRLTTWMPIAFRGANGSDGIAIDPHEGREHILYSAFGQCTLDTVTSAEVNGLWRSEDDGQTWQRIFEAGGIPVGKHNMTEGAFGSNSGKEDRYCNSRIAVDPFNPDVLYVGTRTSGLYRSMNATDEKPSFERLESVPRGLQDSYHNGLPSGVGLVQPDPHRGTIGEGRARRACVIYALARGNHPHRKQEPVHAGGVYRSTDGGVSFELLDGDNAPYIAYSIRFGANGSVYVAGDNGVLSLSDDGKWTVLTGPKQPFPVGMDVLPGEAEGEDVIVALGRKQMFRSSDSGATWETIYHADCKLSEDFWMNHNGAKYWFSKPTGARFDPHHPGRLWSAEPYGPFYFEDVWAENPVVVAAVNGYELTVSTSVAPATGDDDMIAYASVADIGGVPLSSTTHMPTQVLRSADGVKHLHNSPQIATVPSQPGTVLWVQSTGGLWNNPLRDGKPKIWISNDQGQHWRAVDGPALDPTAKVNNNSAGPARIALSSSDPNHAVFVGANRGAHVTTNLFDPSGNVEWQKGDGVPYDYIRDTLIFSGPNTLLVADPLDGDRFYLSLSRPRGNILYVSSDGGKTWTQPTESIWNSHGYKYKTRMAAVVTVDERGQERSELWVGSGDQGLWRSRDGGINFEHVCPSVTLVAGLCFGAPAPGSTTPTLYVSGTRKNDGQPEDGIWMSTDVGNTFARITPANVPMVTGSTLAEMKADPVEFGKLFLATAGNGILYGSVETLDTK